MSKKEKFNHQVQHTFMSAPAGSDAISKELKQYLDVSQAHEESIWTAVPSGQADEEWIWTAVPSGPVRILKSVPIAVYRERKVAYPPVDAREEEEK